jgi:hypothetical protein
MRFFGTRRSRLIGLVSTVLLALAAWQFARLYVRSALLSLGPTLLARAQKELKREIKVDRLEVTRPGVVLIEGLRVARGKTLAEGVLLSARRAEITYDPSLLSWPSLVKRATGGDTRAHLRAWGVRFRQPAPLPPTEIFSTETLSAEFDLAPVLTGVGDVLATVPYVDLGRPHLRLSRDRNGVWAHERLLQRKPGEKPLSFRGEVRGMGGVVDIADFRSGVLPAPVRTHAGGDFAARFGGFPLVQFTMDGRVEGPHAATFRLEGHQQSDQKRWFLTVQAVSNDLPFWNSYLSKPEKHADIFSGAVRASASLWGASGKPEEDDYSLVLDVRNGGANLAGIHAPFLDYQGRLTLSKEVLTVDGTATAAGIPVRLSGEVLTRAAPRSSFRLASNRVTVGGLKRLYPALSLPPGLAVTDPVSATVSFTADHGAMAFTGIATAPQVQYQDGTARALRLSFQGHGDATGAVALNGVADSPEARWKEASAGNARVTFQGRRGKDGVLAGSGKVDVARVRYRETQARALHADLELRDRLVQVEGRLEALGGSVQGTGWVDLASGPGEFYGVGRAEGLDAERVPWGRPGLKVQGRISGDFVLSGTPEAPSASAYVRAAPLTVNGERVSEVTGRVRYAGGSLEIPYATVKDLRLQASLWGIVSQDGAVRLRLTGRGIDLARALSGRVEDPARGTAFVAASVTGTLEQPQVEGQVQVYKPGFRDLDADYARFGFTATGLREVELSGLELVRAPERITSDRLVLTRPEEERAPWNVEGGVLVHGLTLARALRLAGVSMERLRENPLSGDLDPVRVTLSGPVTAPQTGFEAAAHRVALSGLDLGEVTASGLADLARNRVSLSSVTAASSTLHARAGGTVEYAPDAMPDTFARQTRVDLAFSAEGIKLLPLLRRYDPAALEYASVSATLRSASGQLRGTLEAPRATARVELGDVIVNERAVSIDPFQVYWTPTAAVAQDVHARVGSGTVDASYLVALADKPGQERPLLERLAGEVQVRSVPVPVARQLLEDSPYYATKDAARLRELLESWRTPARGVIDLAFGVPAGAALPAAGNPEELAAQVRSRKQPGPLAGSVEVRDFVSPPGPGQPVASLKSDFRYEAGRLSVNEFRLQREDGILVTVSGSREETARAGEKLDFKVRATGLRLGSLSRLATGELHDQVELLQPLDGTVALEGTVSGTAEKPLARFSLEVQRPEVAGIPFDRLTVAGGEYSAEKGILSMASAQLVKSRLGGEPEASLRAAGSLPVTWPDLKVPVAAARHLSVEIPEQSLTVFKELADEAEKSPAAAGETPNERLKQITGIFRQIAATEGRMKGQITLAGSREAPRNDGFLEVSNGALKLDGLRTQVKDFNARLDLEGDVLKVSRFTGTGAFGGTFQGSGDVTLGLAANGGAGARLNLAFALDKFKFQEKKGGSLVGEAFLSAPLNGALQTVDRASPGRSAPLKIVGEWPRPEIVGAIRLDNAALPLELEAVQMKAPPDLPADVLLNLRLIAGGNVWLRNPQMRLKLEDTLVVANTLRAPIITGDLRAVRGTLLLPTMRVRNVEGTVRVAYDGRSAELGIPSAPPVTVDLTGSTSIRVQRSVTAEAEDYDVTFQIRGTPGAGGDTAIRSQSASGGLSVGSEGGLSLSVRSDPPLPGAEIEALIRQQLGVEGFSGTGANVVEALRYQVEQAFAVNVASALTGGIEDKLQSALGLDIFSIDVGVTQPLRLRIGRRLFGNFYGTVTQEFGGVEGQQRRFEVYYRLSPHLRFGYRQEEPIGRQVIFFGGSASF